MGTQKITADSTLRLCELHVHLEGCVWDEHVRRWWDRSQHLFGPPRYERGRSFDSFLEHIRFGYNFLNSPQAYAHVACDYVHRAIRQGIVYAELQVNLALLNTWGFKLGDVLDAVNTETSKIKGCPTLRFIADLPWQFSAESFQTVLNNKDDLRRLGLVAVSMGGDERYARADEVGRAFELARQAQLKTLCHVGELGDAETGRRLVETLRPDRIAHGIAIADWIAQLGPQSPPVDVCLTSNVMTGAIARYEEHPLRLWRDRAVPYSLSTDDPAIFAVDLHHEYAVARRLLAGSDSRDDYPLCSLAGAFDPKAAQAALG